MRTERTLVTAVLLSPFLSLAPWAAPVRAAEPGPEIVHKPDAYYFPGFRIDIQTEIRTVQEAQDARCYFRAKGQGDFHFVDMGRVQESLYYGVLPAPWVDTKAVEYYFSAVTADGRVTKSKTFEIREMETAEAGEWRNLGRQVKEEAKDRLEDEIRKRLWEKYQELLPRWQQATQQGDLVVKTEAASSKGAAGFRDSMNVRAGQPPPGGTGSAPSASSGRGGSGAATAMGALVVVGAGAYALSGGIGKKIKEAVCESKAGDWGGPWGGMDCLSKSETGTWSMTIKSDCSYTGAWTAKAWSNSFSGSISGDSLNGTVSSPSCGTISFSGSVSGNSVSGSYSYSTSGSGSWSGSKK